MSPPDWSFTREFRDRELYLKFDEYTKEGSIQGGDTEIGLSGQGDMEKLVIALNSVIDGGRDADFYRDDGRFLSVYRSGNTLSIQGTGNSSIGLTERDARTLRTYLRNAIRYGR